MHGPAAAYPVGRAPSGRAVSGPAAGAWDRLPVVAGNAIDPGFTAYPLRELAAAALQRAADLGAAARRLPGRTHPGAADRPVRRQPGDPVRRRRPGARGAGRGRRHLGLRVRGGPDPGRRAARRRGSGRGGEGGGRDQRGAHRARRRAGLRRCQLGVRLRGRPAGGQRRRQGRAAGGLEFRPARPRPHRSRGRLAAPGPGVQVLRRRGHHGAAAAGAASPGADRGRGRARRPVRDHAHAGPAGRAWAGVPGGSPGGPAAWDFPAELAQLPELLAGKLAAPSVRPGRYDLVIDPSNLWLVIHESIGHATELDRALGYEAAYAGTSFATPDKLRHACSTAPR